ncbi:MAG: tripartite tricarboxylate transporter TctB family protein [Deltaproteobacteria bacterium]|nr:tripartite tricarboxylate transporter TctB family protein [Deltaproteobacteria bacterium]
MRSRWEAAFDLFLVALVVWALRESRGWTLKTGLFPWAIGFPVLAFALAHLGRDLWKNRGRILSPERRRPRNPKQDPTVPTASIGAWILGFFVAIWLLGFSLAVPVATLLYLKVAGREKWPVSLVVSAISFAFFYGLFDRALHLPFPEAQLLVWWEQLRAPR